MDWLLTKLGLDLPQAIWAVVLGTLIGLADMSRRLWRTRALAWERDCELQNRFKQRAERERDWLASSSRTCPNPRPKTCPFERGGAGAFDEDCRACRLEAARAATKEEGNAKP